MSWTPTVHPLLSPIESATGDQITSVTLSALNYEAKNAALDKAGSDEDDQFFALAKLATGLTAAELDQLMRPDYITISQHVWDMSNLPTSHFLEAQEASSEESDAEPVESDDEPDLNEVTLLQPVTLGGQHRTSLSLQMPRLAATKAMKKLKKAKERAEFITAHCTGLMLPDIALLTVPDWTQLQLRIDDFLNKPAAYFRKETSK